MLAEAVAELPDLLADYAAVLAGRGAGNRSFYGGARGFLNRWPEPQAWALEPLEVRLAAGSQTRPFITFLMLYGHLRPGYDYLLERKFPSILREAPGSPLGRDIDRFREAAARLGYSPRVRTGMASQIPARLLIQSGKALTDLGPEDFAAFEAAISEREARCGQDLKHFRSALYASRAVIYHLGSPAEPAPKRSTLGRWSWERHLEGVNPGIRRSMVSYLETSFATRSRTTVSGMGSELAHFGRFLAEVDPGLDSLAGLERQRHIEPYLGVVARAVNHRTGAPIAASTQRSRIQVVGRMLEDITEWGWAEAPPRRLVFVRDSPKMPQPLPRYLPQDVDRALASALEASPNRLRADALLVLRATGMRIGELVDLELDCVHEVAGQGAWLKVPLGKLKTERMVPLDDETVGLIDRIVVNRSPGRALRHPRTGQLVEFLLTHKGRRVSADTLRDELHRCATEVGVDPVVPHQLRHTYATALVNSGCSLQALMALLGHVSAEMSLRYGRLFDATVRADYERALALAKERLGPVLPQATPVSIDSNWRELPLIKARMAGGYCVRTLAQGVCPYTNICEHCPNYRSDSTFLPTLLTQRADAEALVRDAEQRGWGEEAGRQRRLIERLDVVIRQTQAQ